MTTELVCTQGCGYEVAVRNAIPSARRSAHPCHDCGRAMWAHDRERVYPDDGPAVSYHYEYRCPGGDGP